MVCFFAILKFSKKSLFWFLSSQKVLWFLCTDDKYGKAVFKFSKKVPFCFFWKMKIWRKMTFFEFPKKFCTLKIFPFLTIESKRFFYKKKPSKASSQKNFVHLIFLMFVTIESHRKKCEKRPSQGSVTKILYTSFFWWLWP